MTTSSTSRDEVCRPLFVTPSPEHVPGAWFDQEAVDRVIRFAAHCRHTQGRWGGAPVIFEPWQLDYIVAPIFGWKNAEGNRIVRTAWIEVPRKNGKSTICSVFGLYLAGADREYGAQVYAAAWDKDQARLVFEPSKTMVEASPKLQARYKLYKDTITAPRGSFFRVISADANRKHGYNVHGAIVDEVHVHQKRDLIDVLETGTGSRAQPLIFHITTAGEDTDTSIYAEKHDYIRKLADGIAKDPSSYGVIFGADKDDDWRLEATWRKANPGYGVTISADYFATQAAKAAANPAYLNTFLRLHLNVRTKQVTRWLALEDWDASAGMTPDPGKLRGAVCYGGLDLGGNKGITAIALDFPTAWKAPVLDDDGELLKDSDGELVLVDVDGHRVLWRFFVPAAALADLDQRTGKAASGWVRDGLLTVTEGDVVDYAAIREQVNADAHEFDLVELAFNKHAASQLGQELAEDGLQVIEMTPQGKSLAAPTQEWERLVLSQAYNHGGHPVARFMVDNLAMVSDTANNTWPEKGKSTGPISGPIAALMALDRSIRNADIGGDILEQVW